MLELVVECEKADGWGVGCYVELSTNSTREAKNLLSSFQKLEKFGGKVTS